jgi:hypothetical protein
MRSPLLAVFPGRLPCTDPDRSVAVLVPGRSTARRPGRYRIKHERRFDLDRNQGLERAESIKCGGAPMASCLPAARKHGPKREHQWELTMYQIIPVMPARRGLAGLSRVTPLLTPRRASRLASTALTSSGAVVEKTDRAGARLRELFWTSPASSADAGSDICAHLFQLCRSLQAEHLDARGMACSFDVEPGLLPQPVCDGLGLIVRALIMDAIEHALTGVGEKSVAVALHRRRAIWACSVAHTGARVNRPAGPRSWRAIAEAHAADLKANFKIRSSSQGTITAICFAVDRNNIPAMAAH